MDITNIIVKEVRVMNFFNSKETVLFQGDSITDCGRDRGDICNLGTGYPLLVSAHLSSVYTDIDFTFINKGISGNRACDLNARWDEDCVALKPTVVSILVGINDTWRRYDSNDPTNVEVFENRYRQILTRTKNEVTDRIIMMEPFILPVHKEQLQWHEDLDPKIQCVRALAREFGARYIPLDGMFAAACMKKSPAFWSQDGVHPTVAGHGLIAKAWVDAVR